MKAIIFDLDGTLLNRDESVKQFITAQYDRFYMHLSHIPKEQFCERFIELDCRGYVWKDLVYESLIKHFHIKGISTSDLLEDYIECFHLYCVPFPNLISMLETLKKSSILIGMITNGKGQFQMDNIVALGIQSYFDTILISEWEGIKKPDPSIFQKALQQLDVRANETIFVGDHPINDIEAAKKVGLQTIWKKDDQWNDVKADYIIDDLAEIIPIMLNPNDAT
ncbi:HAD family hydrolase [Psychrobacillus sp. FSL H8-0483]|uniref:HAD family hydrolase n=1 Tax=Psychrobacillus sp. FSL H8-0483 TaxID=2921389 RepID=UPI003159E842